MRSNAEASLPHGSLVARLSAPYIYAITVKEFLYIGESQRHPFLRWATHFGSNGSFLNRLRSHLDTEDLETSKINFFQVEIPLIANTLPPVRQKVATQWLEHAIHVRAATNDLTVRYRLISDTTRTAPLNVPDPAVRSLVEPVFNLLRSELLGMRPMFAGPLAPSR